MAGAPGRAKTRAGRAAATAHVAAVRAVRSGYSEQVNPRLLVSVALVLVVASVARTETKKPTSLTPGSVPAATSTVTTDCPIRLVLAADKREYKLGEIPKIQLRIENVSEKAVWVIGLLDGSDETAWPVWAPDRFGIKRNIGAGRRYPRYRIELLVDRRPPITDVGERVWSCGNMNALRKEDYVRLSPGSSFDPFGGEFGTPSLLTMSWIWRQRGTYRLSVVYDSEVADDSKFHGHWSGEESTQLLKSVARLTARSNGVVFTVR